MLTPEGVAAELNHNFVPVVLEATASLDLIRDIRGRLRSLGMSSGVPASSFDPKSATEVHEALSDIHAGWNCGVPGFVFSERRQAACAEGVVSPWLTNGVGTPHGSIIIGLLKFIIYVYFVLLSLRASGSGRMVASADDPSLYDRIRHCLIDEDVRAAAAGAENVFAVFEG